MADVFLSYSSKDRPAAERIQAALEAAGYSVFWDQETPAGKDWNSWIGEKLNLAKVVVVLWSRASVASRNVVHEATIAVERRMLIPAIVEDLKSTDFPMGFYTVQAADLRGYRGQAGHEGMTRLIAAVAALVGRGAAPGAKVKPRRGGPPWALIGGAGAVVAAAVGAVLYFDPFSSSAATEDAPAAETMDPVAAVLGRWRWDGIACGQGPEATRDGDLLAFAMVDTPTFKHAVESVEGDTVHTIVVEPEDFRGTQYALTRSGDTLEVKTTADGNIDTWEACP